MDTSDFDPVYPTEFVARTNKDAASQPPTNEQDFACANRNLLAVPDNSVVPTRDGKEVAWNFVAFDFTADGELSPDSVHPAVWRRAVLHSVGTLFQVTAAGTAQMYQERNGDLANLTVIVGDSGLVVVDPVGSYETARAALQRYRATREEGQPAKPVKAIVYTQSGVDHFGGARGLFDGGEVPADLKVFAPEGFLADATLRHVTQGATTARLVDYAYGTRLDASPIGLVDSTLGRTVSLGEATLIPPTDIIGGPLQRPTPERNWPQETGIAWREGLYALQVAGIWLVFQPTGPVTASPAQMNLYVPALKTVYLPGPGLLGSSRAAATASPGEAKAAFAAQAQIVAGAYEFPFWIQYEGDVLSGPSVADHLTALRDAAATGLDAGPLAGLFTSTGYAGTPARTVREVWSRLADTPLRAAELAVSAKTALVAHGGTDKAVAAARDAYDAATPDYVRVVDLTDQVLAASTIPLAVSDKALSAAKDLQVKALTQLAYLAPEGRLRNACLTAALDVRTFPKAPVLRFPQKVGDLLNLN
ncbi:MBL fold metallo-hydrolase [Actinomycetota bacterium Odt1-20B]